MTAPKVLRLVRPYQTQVEFIAADGWSIQKDGLVAIGEEELPVGTLVRCEIVLASGVLLIRVEGEVDGYVAARGSRVGGPKLRIRRVTPSSKDFILTVLRARHVSQRPLASASMSMNPARDGTSVPRIAIVEESSSARSKAPSADDSSRPTLPRVDPPSPTGAQSEARKTLSSRPVKAVAYPPNRDALLEQLRTRHRNKAGAA